MNMHGLILTGFNSFSNQAAPYKRTAGAHRIATYMRQRGWDIEVLDFLMGWNLEQLQEFAKSRVTSSTIFIGFGGTFPIWSETLENFFKWFRSTWPNVKIIAGGQISNVYKIEADWYVDGFGERALEALLKHITGNDTVKWQLGINGRKVVKGNQDYPSFPMKDLKISYEDRDFILENETLVTELGRGCIFNCAFCNFPVLGVKEDHSRDADNLYEELQENYDRWGVTKYIIADETVNDYSAKLEKFAGAVKQLNFSPRMYGYARADLLVARPNDWDTMIEMGFTGHHYGIESTNHESLKAIGKGMHPDKLLSGLQDAKRYFKQHSQYRGQVSLIAGLPYETPETLNKTLSWFRNNWQKENVMLFPFYIPKSDGPDTLSRMSINYSKYGYTETEVDLYPKIKELFQELPSQYGLGEGLIENTGMSWQNDTWNILDVMTHVLKFYKEDYMINYGPIMWSQGEYELVFNKPFEYFSNKTMAELFNNSDVENIKNINEYSTQYIQNYINKKLNWRK